MEQSWESRNKPSCFRSLASLTRGASDWKWTDLSFQQIVLRQIKSTCKRMKLNHCLTPSTKINSRWIKDLNVRTKTSRLLDTHIVVNLRELPLDSVSLAPTPHPQAAAAATMWNWALSKLKTYPSEGTIRKVKKQPTQWKKTFGNHIPDERLVSKIQKERSKRNNKKKKRNNPILK